LTLAVLLAAGPAWAADKVLVKVNGAPIKKAEAMDRAWKAYGTAVINEMMDEILVTQEAKAKGLKADAASVEGRLSRIKSQFSDEKTFQTRLSDSGLSVKDLKAQLDRQVLRESLVVSARGLSVTDDEARQFFDSNKDKLGSQESYRLRHIVVATEKEANDFLVAIRAGADFAKLASEVSIDAASKDKGGDLGFQNAGMFQADIRKVVSSLKPGQTSSPVKTDMGFHLIRVEEVRPPKPAVLAEVQGELKAALLADKISKSWPGYIAELRGKAKLETAP
jgi:foldase protein PrsA